MTAWDDVVETMRRVHLDLEIFAAQQQSAAAEIPKAQARVREARREIIASETDLTKAVELADAIESDMRDKWAVQASLAAAMARHAIGVITDAQLSAEVGHVLGVTA